MIFNTHMICKYAIYDITKMFLHVIASYHSCFYSLLRSSSSRLVLKVDLLPARGAETCSL